MSKVWVSITYPVRVEIEFDKRRVDDDDYIEQKQDEACEKAFRFLDDNPASPRDFVIHDSEIPELIE